jgi:hypothetical protein
LVTPTWTEEHRARCEAASWLKRYQACKAQHGTAFARTWWRETIRDIERIRGKRAADKLREQMNAQGSKS